MRDTGSFATSCAETCLPKNPPAPVIRTTLGGVVSGLGSRMATDLGSGSAVSPSQSIASKARLSSIFLAISSSVSYYVGLNERRGKKL